VPFEPAGGAGEAAGAGGFEPEGAVVGDKRRERFEQWAASRGGQSGERAAFVRCEACGAEVAGEAEEGGGPAEFAELAGFASPLEDAGSLCRLGGEVVEAVGETG
jgi:hypothetical protein